MIKQSIKDDIISLSISNKDFSYRIPIEKIGNTINWNVGEKGTKGIIIEQVSSWTLQLFSKPSTDSKHLKQFIAIVQEHAPKSSINWDHTRLALNIQNQYNWLVETNKTAKNKQTNEEIIENLKKKFNLD